MRRLRNMIDSLKSFQEKILEVIEGVIRENEYIILDMNTEDQLNEQGINRLGVEIADYKPYSGFTVSIKQQKNQPAEKVTLKDTGEFHEGFFIEFFGDGFTIKSNDPKSESLTKKYGKQIFGLTEENFQDIAQNYVEPEVRKLLKTI